MKKSYNKLFLNDIRRAVDNYQLIENGDHILVGMSGGKDSIFLLYALRLLQTRSYLDFKLTACHIDIGLKLDLSSVENFCKNESIDFIYKKLDLYDQIFKSSKSPCYLCSNYKRGAMATVAKNLGANKLAYGHHLTDICDTFFLNILKNESFEVFKPLGYNEKHQLYMIRPLLYIKEDIIKKVVENENLPMGRGDLCPHDDKNERNKINEIVKLSSKLYDDFQEKLLKTLEKESKLKETLPR